MTPIFRELVLSIPHEVMRGASAKFWSGQRLPLNGQADGKRAHPDRHGR